MTPEHDMDWPLTSVPGPHFCEGAPPFNQTAFVFSVPGAEEKNRNRPVAGKTGDNLDRALEALKEAAANLFGSVDRYAYRITNAYPIPLYQSQNGRSEATRTELKAERNLERLRLELAGCTLVVFCGAKAQSVASLLQGGPPQAPLVMVPHIGYRGLLTFKDRAIQAMPTSAERSTARLKAWSQQVLKGLP